MTHRGKRRNLLPCPVRRVGAAGAAAGPGRGSGKDDRMKGLKLLAASIGLAWVLTGLTGCLVMEWDIRKSR